MKKLIMAAVILLAVTFNAQAQQKSTKTKPAAKQEETKSSKYNTLMQEAGELVKSGNFKLGAETYTRALEYNIEGQRTLALRAQALYLNRSYELAIEDLDKLIDAGGDDLAEAYFYRGMSKLALQDESGACTDLKIAKELGKEVGEAYEEICGE